MPRSRREPIEGRTQHVAAGQVTREDIYNLWTAPILIVTVAIRDRAALEASVEALRERFVANPERAQRFSVPITADILSSPVGG